MNKGILILFLTILLFYNIFPCLYDVIILIAQESPQRRTETVKPGGMSKEGQGKLIKNYVRLVAELPTTDIADYLKQNQIFTEEMVERILNKKMSR
jgi:hypothetical protein